MNMADIEKLPLIGGGNGENDMQLYPGEFMENKQSYKNFYSSFMMGWDLPSLSINFSFSGKKVDVTSLQHKLTNRMKYLDKEYSKLRSHTETLSKKTLFLKEKVNYMLQVWGETYKNCFNELETTKNVLVSKIGSNSSFKLSIYREQESICIETILKYYYGINMIIDVDKSMERPEGDKDALKKRINDWISVVINSLANSNLLSVHPGSNSLRIVEILKENNILKDIIHPEDLERIDDSSSAVNLIDETFQSLYTRICNCAGEEEDHYSSLVSFLQEETGKTTERNHVVLFSCLQESIYQRLVDLYSKRTSMKDEMKELITKLKPRHELSLRVLFKEIDDEIHAIKDESNRILLDFAKVIESGMGVRSVMDMTLFHHFKVSLQDLNTQISSLVDKINEEKSDMLFRINNPRSVKYKKIISGIIVVLICVVGVILCQIFNDKMPEKVYSALVTALITAGVTYVISLFTGPK